MPLVRTEPTRALERSAATPPAYYGGIREDWKYVRYGDGAEELYDLVADPFQLENVMARPVEERTEEEQQAHADLVAALDRLDDCSGVRDCRVVSP